MKAKKGLVYVFEGNGKGKTSAALGVAVRMLLISKKVVWISWFKSLKWPVAESHLSEVFPTALKMYWAGEGFYIKKAKEKNLVAGAVARDTARPRDHRLAAINGLKIGRQTLKLKNPPDLLILDEIVKAVNEKLLSEKQVLDLIKTRGKTHLVLTGHDCPSGILKAADLVTKMEKIKHPYDSGQLALRGLDY